MTWLLPIRVVNTANRREHWAVKAKRNAAHRRAVGLVLGTGVYPAPPLPVVVTLTRIAPKAFDFDGTVVSMKAVRDQVAAHYGVDDGPKEKRIQWEYAERRGAVREYAVEIEIVGVTT